MPSSIRSSTLEHRTPRLKLRIAKKPLFIRIAPGVSLGYRRNRTAGTWGRAHCRWQGWQLDPRDWHR